MPMKVTAYLCSAAYCSELFFDYASCKDHENREHEVGYDIHDPNLRRLDMELPELEIEKEIRQKLANRDQPIPVNNA